MKGNPKLYRVWKVLAQTPREWISVMYVGKMSNMTCKQVSALVNLLPKGYVIRERDPVSKEIQIYLNLDDTTIESFDREMKTACFHFKECDKQAILEALGEENWISMTEICKITGLDRQYVAHIIPLMDGIELRFTGKINVYRKR